MQDRQDSDSSVLSHSPSLLLLMVRALTCCTPYCTYLTHFFSFMFFRYILGDPNGEHVRIDGFTQRKVKGKEMLAPSASSLALKLMNRCKARARKSQYTNTQRLTTA